MDLDGKALPEVITWAWDPINALKTVCTGLADRHYHRPMVTQVDSAMRPGVCADVGPRGRRDGVLSGG